MRPCFFGKCLPREQMGQVFPLPDERQHGGGRTLLARSHVCIVSYFLNLLLKVCLAVTCLCAAVQGRSFRHMEAEGMGTTQTFSDATFYDSGSDLSRHLVSVNYYGHQLV